MNTAETGGQPSGEDVVAAYEKNQRLLLTLDQHRLTQPWRLSTVKYGHHMGAIVCNPPPGYDDCVGSVEFYGGMPICENCPKLLAEHIITLHNEYIGFGGKPAPETTA